MKKIQVNNRWRQLLQLLILGIIIYSILKTILSGVSIDFETYCPFGGIMALGSKLWLGSLSCSMSETAIFMGIVLLAGIILFGKLFCGYLCPIGSVIEWLGKPFKKLNLPKELPFLADRILRAGKYVLLFFTAYITMTTSELWCKKFDPYFAAVSGFNRDVVIFWGVLSLVTVFVISILIRFFWCKYVCPLSALSNIFENIVITAPLVIIYIILRLVGVEIDILWIIGALCLAGAATEVFRFRFLSLTPFKITIDKANCKDCSLCDYYCPQGIKIMSYNRNVTHPDCNLCMDCVVGCKKEGSLGLRSIRTPVFTIAVIVVLFSAGLILARNFEFATLTERWGNFYDSKRIESFEIKNLRSVKCWGSANSLYRKIIKKKGIVGLDAYAAAHKVVIYYDSEILDTTGVKRAIFSPRKYKLKKFDETAPDSLSILEIGIYGADDLYDNLDIFRLLNKSPYIWGFGMNFGEPIRAEIAFESDSITSQEIIALIEAKGYMKRTKKGEIFVETNFKCDDTGEVKSKISLQQFRKRYFSGTDFKFNNFEKYNPGDLKIFEIGLKNAESIGVRRNLKYLASHISYFDGVVRLKTDFTDREAVMAYYDPSQVDSASIVERIFSDSLEVFLSGGEIKKIANQFELIEPVKILSPGEANLNRVY